MKTKYLRIMAMAVLAAACPLSLAAQGGSDPSALGDAVKPASPNNPRIATPVAEPAPPTKGNRQPARFPFELRSIDGSGNNGAHPNWGRAAIPFLRVTATDYEDGSYTPAGSHRASAREISNAVVAQSASIPNAMRVSDMVWQWGQFLDHDLDLAGIAAPVEHFDIAVPAGDREFDPSSTGTQSIAMERSAYQMVRGVREQVNTITAFIDGSNVYGSDIERARELRTLDGSGRLETSPGDLLPFNTAGLPNAMPAGSDPADFFLAGDFRANEQAGLTAMHTLFVREHNFWADNIRASSPGLSGDDVYEMARAIVGAEMQAITFNEFLPVLLGNRAIKKYRGYKRGLNPSIANVFATACYRFGHSMLSAQLQRLDADGNEVTAGHLSLAHAFFNPAAIIDEDISSLLRGLTTQRAQEVDIHLVDEVRNFLFGPPGAGGFDLASLNIQRGRDHGLPSYNQVRRDFGLRPVRRFSQISSDPAVQDALASVYATVDDVDAWVGGLAEDHKRGALVGPTLYRVLKDQFERLRHGDRFWYESYLPPDMVELVERQTLTRIIRRNTDIGTELDRTPFIARR